MPYLPLTATLLSGSTVRQSRTVAMSIGQPLETLCYRRS